MLRQKGVHFPDYFPSPYQGKSISKKKDNWMAYDYSQEQNDFNEGTDANVRGKNTMGYDATGQGLHVRNRDHEDDYNDNRAQPSVDAKTAKYEEQLDTVISHYI